MRRISQIEQQVVSGLIAGLPARSVVVDAPCGNGRMSRLIAERDDLKLVLLDYDLGMLEAMDRHEMDRLLRRRARADVLALPLAEKSVDLMVNMRLLHHIPDDETRLRMFDELARVTRGRIITSYWSTSSWRYWRRRLRGKAIRGFPISPRAFRRICDTCGLEIERQIPVQRWYEELCLAVCRPAT